MSVVEAHGALVSLRRRPRGRKVLRFCWWWLRFFALPIRPPPEADLSAMAKPKKKREIVFLVCEESGDRNYTLLKKPGTPKLELSKYCPRLRKHTKHVEKKK